MQVVDVVEPDSVVHGVAGRAACWRGVRAEISISRSFADISGDSGLWDWTEPSPGERRGGWEPVALLGFLDIEHLGASVAVLILPCLLPCLL